MEKRLANLDVWVWEYKEKLRNYSGTNFTARQSACDVLITFLSSHLGTDIPVKRTIPLKKLHAKDEEKITGGLRYHSFTKLVIIIQPPSEELNQMCVTTEGDTVLFEITTAFLDNLIEGIRNVRNGEGDYCIYPDRERKSGVLVGERDKQSKEFWFWPCFGHLGPVMD